MRYEASDMMELTWDDELAKGAQMWANQCQFFHDENDVCRFRVGQNLYKSGLFPGTSMSEKVRPKWKDAMESWYEEINDFRGNPTRPGTNYLGTGHFTQLIWAKTQYVGCGFIVHTGYGGSSSYDTKYYVCNYGPAGNWLQQRVYSGGRACSKCPAGSRCNQGLCRDMSAGEENTFEQEKPYTEEETGSWWTTTKKPFAQGGGSNNWWTSTTKRPVSQSGSKPKCDIKILKKYINSCEA